MLAILCLITNSNTPRLALRKKRCSSAADKTESDVEREKNLMSQWLRLAEERNDVLVPQPGSGVPGAPATGCVTVKYVAL